MKVQVRYYSRSGNTKLLAEAIAKGVGTKAISIDDKDSAIKDKTDILFIGGALYAYGIDKNLKEYIQTLQKDMVKKAVVFSTSWISKHSIDLIKKGLTSVGIPVVEEYFYAKSTPTEAQLEEAKVFAKKYL